MIESNHDILELDSLQATKKEDDPNDFSRSFTKLVPELNAESFPVGYGKAHD